MRSTRPARRAKQSCAARCVDGTDPTCIPYNVFAQGGVTPEALNYIQAPGIQVGTIDQNVTQGVITGDLGTIGAKLPWADESIKVAFGVENRHDKLRTRRTTCRRRRCCPVRAARRSASRARPT